MNFYYGIKAIKAAKINKISYYLLVVAYSFYDNQYATVNCAFVNVNLLVFRETIQLFS